MKISIVTAVYNRSATIADAIESVVAQTYPDIEYITVDGLSNDGTEEVISQFSDSISIQIRESDNGIYDALNKGIEAATGDVVGFLHADDMFASDHATQWIADAFADDAYDAVFGYLIYVDGKDPSKIVRYWTTNRYSRSRFRRGWMPPHPTVYVRKEIYDKLGMYRTDLGSSADYECMIRLMYKHKIRVGYVPKIIIKMRTGGQSNASLMNRVLANRDDRRAWIENDFRPPLGLRFTKPLSKLPQYFVRPPKNLIDE